MIGVIGGYGNIGIYVVASLRQMGIGEIKIGGRNPEKVKSKFDDIPSVKVDIEDRESIIDFIKGCFVVINCAGPSTKMSFKLREVCKEIKCNLVDIGMSNKEFDMVEKNCTDISIIYGAGATPGLSALLTRWGGSHLSKVNSLEYYMGSMDVFTKSAAMDYLDGSFGNYSLNGRIWKNRRVQSSELRKLNSVTLPFFQRDVTLIPFFDNESKYVAETLNLDNGKWYTVIDGKNIEKVLMKIQKDYLENCTKAVEDLCRVTNLEMLGRSSYMNIIIQYTGIDNGIEKTITDVLLSSGPAELSGIVAASTASAILNGEMEFGEYALAKVKNPDSIINKIKAKRNINLFSFDKKLEELIEEIEGEI